MTTAHTVPSALIERRSEIEESMSQQPYATGAVEMEVSGDGFSGLLLRPPEPDESLTLVHFHGGGFRMGSARAWAPFLSHVALATGAPVLAVDYPLAPETPYPGALDAARAAVRWAVAHNTAFVLSGDSAGGGLAAAVALSLTEAEQQWHMATTLFSPWLDLRVTNPSFEQCRETDELFSAVEAREAVRLYCPGHDVTDVTLSPGLANWSGQPPLFLEASSTEVLRDDSRNLAAAAIGAGVTVWYRESIGQVHDWPILGPSLPAARTSLRSLADFLHMLRG